MVDSDLFVISCLVGRLSSEVFTRPEGLFDKNNLVGPKRWTSGVTDRKRGSSEDGRDEQEGIFSFRKRTN